MPRLDHARSQMHLAANELADRYPGHLIGTIGNADQLNTLSAYQMVLECYSFLV